MSSRPPPRNRYREPGDYPPPPAGLTYDDVRRAIEIGLGPIMQTLAGHDAKLEKLIVDHVRRSDLDDLRREMQTGFAATESKYVTRELGDQRYGEMKRDIQTLKDHDQVQEQKSFQLGANAVAWIIAALSILSSIVLGIIAIVKQ